MAPLVAQHPVVAVTLAVGWVAACGIGLMTRQALAKPAQKRLEQAGSAADRAVAQWLSGYGRRYRQWVLDSRRYVDVRALLTGGDHTPELDAVYVDVALVSRASHQVSGNPVSAVQEDATARHSVSEFLQHRRPAVLAITGAAGCGKSTLMAYQTREVARSTSQVRRPVPLLLALREHAAAIVGDPECSLLTVARTASRSVPGTEPDGWWDRQLKRGRCVVLLDGLDEVAREEDRNAVATWVEGQISTFPRNDFVITSRPHGYIGLMIPQADTFKILPFTMEKVSKFLNQWYIAAEKHATGAADEAQMRSVRLIAGEQAERLLMLLQANPRLHDLTANPLLLTMIAMVHRYRGALPGSRTDLYQEIFLVTLTRRAQMKNLPEILPGQTKQKLLTTLAYQMMLAEAHELSVTQVLDILHPLIRRLPNPEVGKDFLDDVSHNGLLTELEPARYGFSHLTFQEYLAAMHIKENPDLLHTLTSAVELPWWRETILLYVSMADADQIVRTCLDMGTPRSLNLAFECAETSSELAPDLRGRLEQARSQAFSDDCAPEYRRLIAAVLTDRLTSDIRIIRNDIGICRTLVPSDLFGLYWKDSVRSRFNDRPNENPDLPAACMWGLEAAKFVSWLNGLPERSSQEGFRLPEVNELAELSSSDFGSRFLPESVAGVWAKPRASVEAAPTLWTPMGREGAYFVSADDMNRTLQGAFSDSNLLVQILLATTFDYAVRVAAVVAFTRRISRQSFGHTSHTATTALEVANDLANNLYFYLHRSVALRQAGELASELRAAIPEPDAGPRLMFERDKRLSVDLARALDTANKLSIELGNRLRLNVRLQPEKLLNLERNSGGDLYSAMRNNVYGDTEEIYKVVDMKLLRYYDVPVLWVARGPLGRALRIPMGERVPASDARESFASNLLSSALVRTSDLDGLPPTL